MVVEVKIASNNLSVRRLIERGHDVKRGEPGRKVHKKVVAVLMDTSSKDCIRNHDHLISSA